MANEWRVFVAEDIDGFVWVIYSSNSTYAVLRLKDFGIIAKSARVLNDVETVIYEDEIDVATKHKNVAVFVSQPFEIGRR